MSNKRNFLVSVLLVFSMAAVMLFTESKSGSEQGIIVKLELAPTIQQVKQLIEPYDEEHIAWLRLNTKFDFIFIITYSALFFFALKGLLENFGKVSTMKFIPLLAFVPGLLDVVENLFILHFLNRDFGTSYFNLYYWCVHLKWGLVALFVLLSLTQLIRIIIKK